MIYRNAVRTVFCCHFVGLISFNLGTRNQGNNQSINSVVLPERTELQEELKIVLLSLCLQNKVLAPLSTGPRQTLERMKLFSPVLLSWLVEAPGGSCSWPLV